MLCSCLRDFTVFVSCIELYDYTENFEITSGPPAPYFTTASSENLEKKYVIANVCMYLFVTMIDLQVIIVHIKIATI